MRAHTRHAGNRLLWVIIECCLIQGRYFYFCEVLHNSYSGTLEIGSDNRTWYGTSIPMRTGCDALDRSQICWSTDLNLIHTWKNILFTSLQKIIFPFHVTRMPALSTTHFYHLILPEQRGYLSLKKKGQRSTAIWTNSAARTIFASWRNNLRINWEMKISTAPSFDHPRYIIPMTAAKSNAKLLASEIAVPVCEGAFSLSVELASSESLVGDAVSNVEVSEEVLDRDWQLMVVLRLMPTPVPLALVLTAPVGSWVALVSVAFGAEGAMLACAGLAAAASAVRPDEDTVEAEDKLEDETELPMIFDSPA